MSRIYTTIIVFFLIACHSVCGQITVTGEEHIINSYSEAFGKTIIIQFENDDISNLFVRKKDKMRCITKVYDQTEIAYSIVGPNQWFVKDMVTDKKKNYLRISRNNNEFFLLLKDKNYLSKMRNDAIYNQLIVSLNKYNDYFKKIFFQDSLNSAHPSTKALVCNAAYHVKWVDYCIINDTVYLTYYFVDDIDDEVSGLCQIPASSVKEESFLNRKFIEDCKLREQQLKDSLEDEKLHAFLVFNKDRSACDTVYCYSSTRCWHHQSIRYMQTNDIATYSPDSTYSQLRFGEYVEYLHRRGDRGLPLRMGLARHADSLNSVGYMQHMQNLAREQEEQARANNPLVAKPRINEAPRKFAAKSTVVSNIKGWEYNKDKGKWVGFKNRIGGSNSFLSCKALQLCSFQIDGQIYYVLKITVFGGEWRYPALGLDFIPYDEYYLYVFEKEDINSLVSPKEAASLVQSRIYDYENYNEKHTDNMILRDLEKLVSRDKRGFLWVQRSGSNIRFNFKTYLDSAYDHYDKWLYDRLQKKFDPYDLITEEVNSRYFEIPLSEWNKLFTIVK